MSRKTSSSHPSVPMRDLSNAGAGPSQKRLRDTIEPASPPPAPEGFTMINKFQTELWAEDALKQVDKLDEEADKRNPDLYDMHVYSDFYAWGLYDLIEDKFREFRELLKKEPTSIKTWHVLEALTFFIATLDEGELTGIDDCNRYCAFVRVFAAAWYTLVRRRQTAQPKSLLTPADILNTPNVMMTAGKIIQSWCEVTDLDELELCRGIPALFMAILRQEGWEVQPKSTRILGEYGETPEELEHEERPRKRTRSSTRSDRISDMPFRKALAKQLDTNDKSLNFDKLWRKYEKDFAGTGCIPLFEVGNEWAMGFDITKWPAEVRAKHSFARQLEFGDSDDEVPYFVPRDARKFQSLQR